MEIKLGIIGYGGMGKWHAANAPRAGVRIAAVCDIRPDRVEEARTQGFTVYGGAGELLRDGNVNTVILTVPNHLDCEMALLAAKAGKHVITEKPAALSVAELDRMDEACKGAGVLFTAHQNRRWDKDMLTAKKCMEENLVGNVFTIESTLHSGNGYMHEWHLYKKYGGGMMYDWGVHLIDQILFMLPGAKIKSLFADIKKVLHEEVDDYFKILMRLSNGITAQIELSTYILDYQPRWLVGGDRGTVIIKDFMCNGNVYRTGRFLDRLPSSIVETVAGPTRQFAPVPPGGITTGPLPSVESDWTDFYRNVCGALNGTEALKVQISEVRRVLTVMEAAVESVETGKAIALEA